MVEPWLHFTSSLWISSVGFESTMAVSESSRFLFVCRETVFCAPADDDAAVEDAARVVVEDAFVELERVAVRPGVIDDGVLSTCCLPESRRRGLPARARALAFQRGVVSLRTSAPPMAMLRAVTLLERSW
jgi:hypothetical protein